MTIIRNAAESDLPEMLNIYNDIIEKTTAVYEYKPHTLAMRQQWFMVKKESGFPVFVAEENEALVGFSSIGSFRNWAAYKYSVENSVYVATENRGKGIGKSLLLPLIESAKQMNMHTIIASIDNKNESSLRLHKSLGIF